MTNSILKIFKIYFEPNFKTKKQKKLNTNSNYSRLLILILLILFNFNLFSQCDPIDWAGLKALYESTNGDGIFISII